MDDGATVVDVRPVDRVRRRARPRPLSIPLRAAVRDLARLAARPKTPWSSWSATPTRTPPRSLWQAAKVGYDICRGARRRHGGLDRCRSGDDLDARWSRRARDSTAERVLDVRQDASSPPGTCPAPSTSSSAPSPPRRRRWPTGRSTVMCGHGERAMTAASLLERAGRHDVARAARRAPGLGAPSHGADAGVPARDGCPDRTGHGPCGSGCAPTWPSSACWSRSTRWSAGCSARNARCCRCSPTSEFGLDRLHRGADLHPGVRRGQGGHQLRGRHLVGPLRPQTGAGRRLAGRACRCRCC